MERNIYPGGNIAEEVYSEAYEKLKNVNSHSSFIVVLLCTGTMYYAQVTINIKVIKVMWTIPLMY